MIYGSICSGIEAATAAWHPLGWRPAFFSEIDKAARTVLAARYPKIPCHGDFTTIKRGQYETIDLLVAGTPCQDFSVAGKRLGISAPRGNLALEFLRLAKRLRPRWLVFENVPGLLSSWSGAPKSPDHQGGGWEGYENSDFAAFLGAVRECGYLGCWRSLDAQFAGLAQRRERLFFVGYLGDWRPPAAVLFERESLCGDSPPRREAGEGITGTLNARAEGGGGLGTDFECMGGQTAHTLRADGFDASEDGTGRGTPLVPMISPALKARDSKGPSSDGDGDGAPLIPLAIPINTQLGLRGPDTSNSVREGIGIGEAGDPMFTLQAAHQHAVAFDCKASGRNGFGEGDISPTLRKMDGARANGGGHAAVAFAQNQRGELRTSDVSSQLTCGGGKPREGYPAVAFESRYARNGRGAPSGISSPLKAHSGRTGKGDGAPLMQQDMAVRRLTPRECERLQGFEDDYTLVPYAGRMMADGPRYKMLGNSMAVPVMRQIGERIVLVDKLVRKK